ncbi:MAG: DUF3106 domain-containing protein [Giesbergeria sp.]|nr:DUF3106 domain-containing protein [Giesbergeria sp.]MBP6159240.1 DUF3106 domain-containing protein [Giesbergeria sp.]MBP7083342.1 DUF3106 domain-containing protein [Giesbergeria sp.]MBP9783645.1 DUF3106 domain-containing protein [Giesbergeria sp.]MBP9894536.1 DUF3106 domain-containing protein [Giesbergeria sp.]
MAPGTAIPEQALESAGERSAEALTAGPRKPLRLSGPGWELMTTPQKLALYPLAERWAYLSETQKRRWLVLAENFGSLSEPEQQRLHERMTDWASLSAQQRSQARLNFAVTRDLAPQDIQSQWEAYQALSKADKQRLAAHAAKPRGAATALMPVPAKRLARVPAAPDAQAQSANPPKIVFPSTTAVRATPAPEPIALPPSPLPPASSSAQAAGAGAPGEVNADAPPRPSDPLPDPYVN